MPRNKSYNLSRGACSPGGLFFYCCMNFHDAFPEVHFRWVYSSDNLDCSFLMTGELCHVIAMFTGAVSHKLLRRFSGYSWCSDSANWASSSGHAYLISLQQRIALHVQYSWILYVLQNKWPIHLYRVNWVYVQNFIMLCVVFSSYTSFKNCSAH
jgi:hypothetical protein